jgi:hypothetical protein
LRLRASAARTARPCGESLLELTFQTLGRDVMFCLNLHRDLDPDPRGLEADDLHVVGHVLPVRMVIALAFFKRIFTRSLPMNQAHGLIIGDVYGTCCVSTNTTFWGAGATLLPREPAAGEDVEDLLRPPSSSSVCSCRRAWPPPFGGTATRSREAL